MKRGEASIFLRPHDTELLKRHLLEHLICMAGGDKIEPGVSGKEVSMAFFAVEYAETRMTLVV